MFAYYLFARTFVKLSFVLWAEHTQCVSHGYAIKINYTSHSYNLKLSTHPLVSLRRQLIVDLCKSFH